MFVDQTIDNQYAMRYYLDLPNHSNNVIFQSRNNGPCYQLGPLTISTWGGKDPYHDPSGCYIQYLRMCWDCVADSEEKMYAFTFWTIFTFRNRNTLPFLFRF